MTPSRRNPHLISRLQGLGTTIFSEMTALARQHDAVNLGQGFPDRDGPAEVAEAAVEAIRAGHNQYAPGHGVAPLRSAIAGHQRRFYGMAVDPDAEVTVTAGATEALCAAILALCETGDEVLTFEPWYDSYAANIAMAGARRVAVPLRGPGFRPDLDEVAAALTPRTRLLLLNTPHNPTGTVLTGEELRGLAALAIEHDLLVVTDEVYEHLVFDGEHVPIATLPGMRERTVTISSAGKTFSFTGWKVGWMVAPPALTDAVRTTKQFLSFSNGTPFQHAIAEALALDDAYYAELAAGYRARRDLLADGLDDIGFGVTRPQGTYFVTADIRPLGYDDCMAFCRDLPGEVGVAAVPNAAFYDHTDRGRPFVRFAFCKTPATLETALERLATLRERT